MSNSKNCFLVLEPQNHMWLVVKAAKELGYRTVVVHNMALGALPPYDEGLDYVDQKIFVKDWFDHQPILDSIKAELQDYQIAGIYSCPEYTLLLDAKIRKEYDIPGVSESVLNQILDKKQFRELLLEKNLTKVKTYSIDDFLQSDDIDKDAAFILKPAKGSGSALVKKIFDKEHLIRELKHQENNNEVHISSLKRYIDTGNGLYLEDEAKGHLISVESLSYKGRVTVLGITTRSVLEREPTIEMGATFPYEVKFKDQIQDYVSKLHEVANYHHGASHVELMLDDEGNFDLIEFNARFVGADVILAINKAYDTEVQKYLVEMNTGTLDEQLSLTLKEYVSLQYILPPNEVTELKSFELDESNVSMLKMIKKVGASLSSSRNQMDHIACFMISDPVYTSLLVKSSDTRASISINDTNIAQDENNQVVF